jgi:hypothetical protein
MTSFSLRLNQQVGEHYHCSLFAGPDTDHLALVGTLALREAEFNVLSTLTRPSLTAIAEERYRQVDEEGYTFAHDDAHGHNDLADAAASYAQEPESRRTLGGPPRLWPWAVEDWKPDSEIRDVQTADGIYPGDLIRYSDEGRLRELTKAGALLVADIDRRNRAKEGN